MPADGSHVDRAAVEMLFGSIARLLGRWRSFGSIRVYGGTAVMLQIAGRKATEDIDCVVTEGHGLVFKAVEAIRRDTRTPSWLNESVSVYTSKTESSADFVPFAEYPSLRVSLARPEYLLAMKIEALPRNAPRDTDDVRLFASHLGLSSVEQAAAVHGRYFPARSETGRLETVLHDLGHSCP